MRTRVAGAATARATWSVMIRAHGTFVSSCGTYGPFSELAPVFTLLGEQFWGRAARASQDSQESGTLVIYGSFSAEPPGSSIPYGRVILPSAASLSGSHAVLR